jgi:hypothetical protein
MGHLNMPPNGASCTLEAEHLYKACGKMKDVVLNKYASRMAAEVVHGSGVSYETCTTASNIKRARVMEVLQRKRKHNQKLSCNFECMWIGKKGWSGSLHF